MTLISLMKRYVQIKGRGAPKRMTEQTKQGVKAAATMTAEVVDIVNPAAQGRVVLVCEHASNVLPPEFGDLGLDAPTLYSHIAWDLGAMAVARLMSAELDAPLIAHRFSRLVYDCNRSPDAHDAIPSSSEHHEIPGNASLSDEARKARTARYYAPFCDALSACLESRAALEPVLVTVHSFTPVYMGDVRTVEIGVLHDSDARLADAMMAHAQGCDLDVQCNVPYGPQDGVTFTLTRHALPRGLLNVMIEIRNDLIDTEAGQEKVAKLLVGWLRSAVQSLDGPPQREAS